MFFPFFNSTALLLFALQYSYNAVDSSKYIYLDGPEVRTCVYEGDRPFKRGSSTYPRSELRLLGDLVDGTYNFSVEVGEVDVPNGFDFSYYQLFGTHPLVMVRQRMGDLQLVVFDGEPKIHLLDDLPTSCVIKCGPQGYVECGQYRSVAMRRKGIRCDNQLYPKVGIYSQQMKPFGTACINYKSMKIELI